MEKHIFLVILLFLSQYYFLSISVAASSNYETDQQALLAFQNLIVTSPTSHFLANNWTKNTSFCSWFGVTCSPKRQRVVSLSLPNLQLQGTISPSLANLSFLRELNLGNNSFRGSIPYGIGHLPRLRVVDIQSNQLQGSIPTSCSSGGDSFFPFIAAAAFAAVVVAGFIVLAVRTTVVAWITVLVLLAFVGKRRRVLAKNGKKITSEVAFYIANEVIKEKGFVAVSGVMIIMGLITMSLLISALIY